MEVDFDFEKGHSQDLYLLRFIEVETGDIVARMFEKSGGPIPDVGETVEFGIQYFDDPDSEITERENFGSYEVVEREFEYDIGKYDSDDPDIMTLYLDIHILPTE